MVAPERPVFIGHVWMTGGPWLIADRLDGETWTGIDGDYQEEILPLTAWDTEISFGDWGLVLSSDYDDSPIEVVRVSPSELLILGVRYADAIQRASSWRTLARSTSSATVGWTFGPAL